MSLYQGFNRRVGRGGLLVLKNGARLDPSYSQKAFNHSPDGFNWGYGGSGPAQLALALLLEETGFDQAVLLHQEFKREVVAKWPWTRPWSLTGAEIRAWLATKGRR